MSSDRGWAQGDGDAFEAPTTSPVSPPPPPPRNPAPAPVSPPPSAQAPLPPSGLASMPPVSGPVSSPPVTPPGDRGRRGGVSPKLVAIGALVVLLIVGALSAGLLLGKNADDQQMAEPPGTGAAGAGTDSTDAAPLPVDEGGDLAADPGLPVVPTGPIVLDDNRGETQKDNAGPRLTSAADIRQVRVVPAAGDGPAWVFVEFWGAPAPAVGVIVRFDTDGDNRPEFVSWRHLTNGTSGSGPVVGWGHGRETLRGNRQADPRFQAGGHVPPESGTAFPFRLAPGDLPAGVVRVNVQVISDAGFYDYAPHRQVWSESTGVGPAS